MRKINHVLAGVLKARWQNVRKAYRLNYVSHNGRPNYGRTEDLNFLDPTFTIQRHVGELNHRAQNALDEIIQELEVEDLNHEGNYDENRDNMPGIVRPFALDRIQHNDS